MGARIGTNMDVAFDYIFDFETGKNVIDDSWFENNKECFNYSADYSNLQEKTNFQRITKIRKFTQKFSANFDGLDKSEIQKFIKNFDVSMQELEIAVADSNYVETIKYLCKLLYYSYEMSAYIGTNMDLAFDIVHFNNMSKLCFTEDIAEATVKYYVLNANKLGYDSPNYRLAPNGIHWIVFNESTKKILKSIKWKEVDLTVLFN
jgi:hypothetical protein